MFALYMAPRMPSELALLGQLLFAVTVFYAAIFWAVWGIGRLIAVFHRGAVAREVKLQRATKRLAIASALATSAPVYFFCPWCTDFDVWFWW